MDNNEIFKPESKTIKSIFGDTSSFYQMPDYQRPYSWEDEQVDQLWEDIITACDNYEEDNQLDENYFLGSVILIPKGKFNDVVDGQQRLTTLLILFCVIRDLFPNLNEEIDISENPDTVTIDDINDFISLRGKRDRIKLKTDINNQNDFEDQIIHKVKFPEKFTKKDKQTKKYLNTAILFKKHLIELDKQPGGITNFVDYLFNRVRMITITCSSEPFAVKLFQVLNARGMDLSPSDLIKSFLYGNITDKEKRPQFMATWREIETLSENLGDSITDLFTIYQYHLLASNPKRNLYEELSKQFKGKDSNKIITDFKNFVISYRDVSTSKSKVIYSFYYLRHQIYWKSILATAKHVGYKDIDKLSLLLRDFYYIYWIGGYTSAKIKQPSFNIIKWVKEGVSHQDIQEKLKSKMREDKAHKWFRESINDWVYGEKWLKPLLILIEYNQTDDNNSMNYIKIDRDIHIEHVLPVENRKYKYWCDLYSEEEAEEYLNTLGNMTLLSGTKNISASNKPFTDKKDVYKGKGKDGITGFRITQEIYDNYETWDESELLTHTKWLKSEIKSLFSIKKI